MSLFIYMFLVPKNQSYTLLTDLDKQLKNDFILNVLLENVKLNLQKPSF